MRPWIYLLFAIISEVIGTTSMKLSLAHLPLLGYTIMYTLITLSYYFLALAMKKIPIGLAYALWEGLGITLITIISALFFNEHLTTYKICSLLFIIGGILLIKSGSVISEHDKTSYNEA